MIYLYTWQNGISFLQTEEKMRCRICWAPSQNVFIRKRCTFQNLLTRYVSKKTFRRFPFSLSILCSSYVLCAIQCDMVINQTFEEFFFFFRLKLFWNLIIFKNFRRCYVPDLKTFIVKILIYPQQKIMINFKTMKLAIKEINTSSFVHSAV